MSYMFSTSVVTFSVFSLKILGFGVIYLIFMFYVPEYLKDVIYKLSEVGQAIENNNLPAAGSFLGQSTTTEWVQKANAALSKLISSIENKNEVDTFSSSLSSLISSVVQNDTEASKIAFVASASAFENWTILTGLVGQLKGL